MGQRRAIQMKSGVKRAQVYQSTSREVKSQRHSIGRPICRKVTTAPTTLSSASAVQIAQMMRTLVQLQRSRGGVEAGGAGVIVREGVRRRT